MKGFAPVSQPITGLILTKIFQMKDEQKCVFQKLKRWINQSPGATSLNVWRSVRVDVWCVKVRLRGNLGKKGHPVAYLSHCLSEAETRWDTGDQEVLATMIALREWSLYLNDHSFLISTDHYPIKYL